MEPEFDKTMMTQAAPYPCELAELVRQCSFRPGYKVALEYRDRGQGSTGLTLVVTTSEPDTYNPHRMLRVHHYFIVPAASYNTRSWRRWLFEQLSLVSRHEDMEWFQIAGECMICNQSQDAHLKPTMICPAPGGSPVTHYRAHRPYSPLHGPGNDPYMLTELADDTDKRTSFRGHLNEVSP